MTDEQDIFIIIIIEAIENFYLIHLMIDETLFLEIIDIFIIEMMCGEVEYLEVTEYIYGLILIDIGKYILIQIHLKIFQKIYGITGVNLNQICELP